MKKKLTIVVMVVLAAILIASPVLAAGSSHLTEVAKVPKKRQKPTVISMTGKITDLDQSAGKITIQVQMTNKPFIKYRGKPLLVETTSTTKYIWWVGKVRDLSKGFKDLQIGDKVSINAKLRPNGNFYARRVQVRQPRYP